MPACRSPRSAGLHAGCYELFAREPIRSVSDLKGRRVGIQTLASSGASVSLDHGDLRRPRPPAGHRVGRAARRQRHGAVRRRRHRRVPRLSARAAGAARARLRPGDPEHDQRPAVVAVLLLHDPRRTAPGCAIIRSRPSVSCARCSRPPSSARPTRRTRRAGSSMAGSRRNTTTRSRRSASCPTSSGTSTTPRIRLRFYALRLHEAGMLRTSPNALLAEGTDWRFVNELKRELKA